MSVTVVLIVLAVVALLVGAAWWFLLGGRERFAREQVTIEEHWALWQIQNAGREARESMLQAAEQARRESRE